MLGKKKLGLSSSVTLKISITVVRRWRRSSSGTIEGFIMVSARIRDFEDFVKVHALLLAALGIPPSLHGQLFQRPLIVEASGRALRVRERTVDRDESYFGFHGVSQLFLIGSTLHRLLLPQRLKLHRSLYQFHHLSLSLSLTADVAGVDFSSLSRS
ncbi:hypothetical protein NE237_016907 [Protea cynaroides]|uniref:Uncharacterized protein n=1 Tax=Protea cynaroides TaxID=273540 RepID=A0A9Q0K748_9MAGN|nr:hypothetical protein NE237_016907 [Protea cynaroides]